MLWRSDERERNRLVTGLSQVLAEATRAKLAGKGQGLQIGADDAVELCELPPRVGPMTTMVG